MANDAYIPDDLQNEEDAQINQEEYELWSLQHQAEFKAYKSELAEKFNDYIYDNYSVANGEQLINILEDGEALDNFLDLMGLPPDTEIDL